MGKIKYLARFIGEKIAGFWRGLCFFFEILWSLLLACMTSGIKTRKEEDILDV